MGAFAELVGCRLPLQLAGMTRVSNAPLAAAVSNAGGLGMLGIGRLPASSLAIMLDEVVGLTTAPVGATFIVEFADPEAVALAAERLGIVEYFWGEPTAALLPKGAICGWQVGSVDEARAAEAAGCHYVIAQGLEAGGHVRSLTPRRQLVPAVRAAVGIPVVAAGGIGSAHEVRHALEAGADAVRIGTRFVAAEESEAHPFYVDALIGAAPEDAVLTDLFDVGWPEAPVRVVSSCIAAAVATTDEIVGTITMPGGVTADLKRRGTTPPTVTTTGRVDAMPLYAGRSVGAVTRRQPAAEIVAELTSELA